MGSFILGRKIAKLTPKQKTVGVLLPNAIGGLLTLFGLQAFGRVPAMLNFSTGAINMSAACMRPGHHHRVIAHHRGGNAARYRHPLQELPIIYLGDVRETSASDKLYGLFARFFSAPPLAASKDPAARPYHLHAGKACPRACPRTNSPQTGYRPRPHVSAPRYCLQRQPMFHAFGLLGGNLLPVLSGVYSFLSSPLHYKIVPELATTRTPLLGGTDTFLAGYARTANPMIFRCTDRLRRRTGSRRPG
jgi:acyl-[acyl-carrier-protein]-phospholipid O-acyltransferase/long-chain-fatty-acid--[acyl-carrier-protein] ligase